MPSSSPTKTSLQSAVLALCNPAGGAIVLLGLIAGIYGVLYTAQTIADALGVPLDLWAASGTGLIAKYLIALICIGAFATWVWGDGVTKFFLLYLREWATGARAFSYCAGLTFVISILWFSFVLAIGGAHFSSAAWAQADTKVLTRLLGYCLLAIMVATTEELLFRGLAFRYLLDFGGKRAVVAAALLSSLLFALSHHFNSPSEWLELKSIGLLIGLTLGGCMLALVYYTTNSLSCSSGVHSALIWIAVLKKTQIVQVGSTGWAISNFFDPRTGPAAWALFVLLGAVFWSLRGTLREKFAIENFAPAPNKYPAALRRDQYIAGAGILACLAGFSVVQTTIGNRMGYLAANFNVAVEQLKAAISTNANVAYAARIAKFEPGDFIRAQVTKLSRLANGKVEFAAWVADRSGEGSPVVVLLIERNKTIGEIKAAGAHAEFARLFKLTDVSARNVIAGGQISCEPNAALTAVVATPAWTYWSFPLRCPPSYNP